MLTHFFIERYGYWTKMTVCLKGMGNVLKWLYYANMERRGYCGKMVVLWKGVVNALNYFFIELLLLISSNISLVTLIYRILPCVHF